MTPQIGLLLLIIAATLVLFSLERVSADVVALGARFLASTIVNLVGRADPLWMLTGFFGFTVLLTQPMSNPAAAVVILPVALQTAMQLDLNPRTFAMMIAVAASCSYMTPLEPSCLMVYGPGRYRFLDFLKVGSLLTVLIYILSIVLVPLIWPLR